MVDFRELGIKRVIENGLFEDEDLEIIGKIHNLANDPLVSRVEEENFNYSRDPSYYSILLKDTLRREEILGFLGDNGLNADDASDAQVTNLPYFRIKTADRIYYLEFFTNKHLLEFEVRTNKIPF